MNNRPATHRRRSQTVALREESIFNIVLLGPCTADEVRVALFRQGASLHLSTIRKGLESLRDEGRLCSERIRGGAFRNGIDLWFVEETSPEAITIATQRVTSGSAPFKRLDVRKRPLSGAEALRRATGGGAERG